MASIAVTKVFGFEAAHVLPWHPGKCSTIHGHSYRLEVTVSGDIDERGVVMEFGDLGDVVQVALLDRCDHRLLNDLDDNPTAERLALLFFRWLREAGLAITSLTLWETASSRATVQE